MFLFAEMNFLGYKLNFTCSGIQIIHCIAFKCEKTNKQNVQNVGTPAMKNAWKTAHSHIHSIFSTPKSKCGKWIM